MWSKVICTESPKLLTSKEDSKFSEIEKHLQVVTYGAQIYCFAPVVVKPASLRKIGFDSLLASFQDRTDKKSWAPKHLLVYRPSEFVARESEKYKNRFDLKMCPSLHEIAS